MRKFATCGARSDRRDERSALSAAVSVEHVVRCGSARKRKPMKRRQFITLVGGAVAAWPLVASAQQRKRIRLIGILMNTSVDDSVGQSSHAAFVQGLQQLGWEIGNNVQIDTRWGAGDTELFRKYAAELVGSQP